MRALLYQQTAGYIKTGRIDKRCNFKYNQGKPIITTPVRHVSSKNFFPVHFVHLNEDKYGVPV